MRVTVVGAGVIGLSVAHELLVRGYEVTIVSKVPPEATHSRVAAAIWHVFLIEFDNRIDHWAQRTISRLNELAGDQDTGVSIVYGIEYLRRSRKQEKPAWASLARHFRWLDSSELPQGIMQGYEVGVPFADMSIYLNWLASRIRQLGAKVELRTVNRLDDHELDRVVVNCSGYGARELAPDPAVYSMQGQVVYYTKPKGLDSYFGDDEHPEGMTYMIPRTNDIVVGGTADRGRDDLVFDEDRAIRAFERCCEFIPRLREASLLSSAVGVRPCRDTGIRFEIEELDSKRLVIHNYAHGGSGFSLSWGCAEEVADIVDSCASQDK